MDFKASFCHEKMLGWFACLALLNSRSRELVLWVSLFHFGIMLPEDSNCEIHSKFFTKLQCYTDFRRENLIADGTS